MKNLKRIFAFVLVVLSVLMFVGCGDAKTSKQVSNKINKETQKIIQVLNSLDSATDTQLEIKDISPLSSAKNVASASNTNISNVSFNKKNDYVLFNNKKVNVQNKSYLPEKIGFYDENNKFIKQKEPYSFKQINNNINQQQVNQDKVKINEDKVKNFSYQPKYVNDTSKSFSTENLQNYFAKIEDLYNTCSDCICANAECNNCKQNLKIACNNCKSLCNKLNDGSIELSQSQIDECNSCIKKLNDCMSKLNSTKGDLNSLLSTLRPLMNNYYGNFDSLCKCYGQIGECLDTRISDINNCTECVNELSDIICPNGNCVTSSNKITQTTLQNSKINNVKKTTDKITGQKTNANNTIKKFYGPIKQKILNAMQSSKNTDKSNVSNTMQTKNANKINTEKSVVEPKNEINETRNRPDTKIQPRTFDRPVNPTQNITNSPLNQGVGNNYTNFINNRANGYNNNMMYGSNGYANGVFPYGNYKNLPNIDTYGALPRNIDTYHNIYTNIDTYGKEYFDEQNTIVDEEINDGQNDIVLNDEKMDNKKNEQVIDNTPNQIQTIENQPQNVTPNLNVKQDKTREKTEENDTIEQEKTEPINNTNTTQNITTLELEPENLKQKVELTDAPIVNSPLPNPFDPNKVEKEQNPQTENLEKEQNDTDNLELNKENGQIHDIPKDTLNENNVEIRNVENIEKVKEKNVEQNEIVEENNQSEKASTM